MKRNVLHVMICAAVAASLVPGLLLAQPGVFSKEDLIKYTPEWKGERFPDGRPRVPDGILERMRSVTLEEAWAVLRNAGFTHEYEDGWLSIHPDKVCVDFHSRLSQIKRCLRIVWSKSAVQETILHRVTVYSNVGV